MKKTDTAEKMFNGGYNCSQAVLAAYSADYGLADEAAYKLASGFGGGMGRMQETCGAVTGAFMVLGLDGWNTGTSPDQAKEKTYTLVNEFVREFRARNKTISCRGLLGCDLNSPEGYQYFKNSGLRNKVCMKCIKDAVEILGSMLKKGR
jgi:C_GCAxxG_C_C family probable redox protein